MNVHDTHAEEHNGFHVEVKQLPWLSSCMGLATHRQSLSSQASWCSAMSSIGYAKHGLLTILGTPKPFYLQQLYGKRSWLTKTLV